MAASILIVDDEKNIRTTLTDILEEEGCEVLAASTGEQAVKLCERRRFDVVLLDVRMPGIDGIEALRRIRRQRDGVKVILMSAYGVGQVERTAIEEGAIAFMRKPLDIRRIIELIRS